MMATTAQHKTGDISRDDPDFCLISSETETEYIGRWLEGYGFYNVRFPKSTTREMTPEEKEKFENMDI